MHKQGIVSYVAIQQRSLVRRRADMFVLMNVFTKKMGGKKFAGDTVMDKKQSMGKYIQALVMAVCILFSSVFCACCQAEPLTEAEEKGETAVLKFSSFDGGGPEYYIELDDPGLVSYTCRRVYDNEDHEMMTGSGYTNIYTFTGLKSGTTGMTVYVSSPLMENFDFYYTIMVDDDLNVTMKQERAISRFELYRSGDAFYDTYEIITLQNQYSVSVNREAFRSIEDGIVDALYDVIEKYDLYRWDGFDEYEDGILDGESFRLEIDFSDGTSIWASGANAFPEDYFPVMGEMQEILESIREKPSDSYGDLEDFLTTLLSSAFSESHEKIVGTDIAYEDISDFYYTYDASFYPPEYQRYRFYVEDGKKLFYHETREGDSWPQTEEDISVFGTVALTEEEWAAFCNCLEGGTVRKREENLEAGDAGPWFYLYWDGDQGEYQEFSFASREDQFDFESFCTMLKASGEQDS